MKRSLFPLLVLLAVAGCKKDDSTSSQAPVINSMVPSQVLRGQTVEGQIKGANFNGVLVVQLGDGIKVLQITGVANNEINLRFFVNNNATPGPRSVSVTTAAGTATSTSVLTVGSNRPPNPVFSVTPSVGVTQTVFTFDASASSDPDGSITSYQWNFGDNQTAGGQRVTHKYASPGLYKVALTITDNDQGQSVATRDLEIKNGRLPIARFNVTPDKGDTTTLFRFDASASEDPDGRIVEYKWIFSDGGRRKGKVIERRFSKSDSHEVELVVRDNDGLEDTTEKRIHVRGSAPVANFTVTPEIGDYNTVFRFDGTSSYDRDGRILAYSWNFGDGSSGSGAVVTHKYSRAASFPVQLTVTDDDGVRASTTRNFRVYEPDGGGGGGEEGRCTTPSKKREPFFFEVVSENRASKIIVGRFLTPVTCSDVFYLCGDVRKGGIRPGEKEYWMGIICEMYSLGNNTFRMHLRQGKDWVTVGERETYVWPQLDCNPDVVCR